MRAILRHHGVGRRRRYSNPYTDQWEITEDTDEIAAADQDDILFLEDDDEPTEAMKEKFGNRFIGCNYDGYGRRSNGYCYNNQFTVYRYPLSETDSQVEAQSEAMDHPDGILIKRTLFYEEMQKAHGPNGYDRSAIIDDHWVLDSRTADCPDVIRIRYSPKDAANLQKRRLTSEKRKKAGKSITMQHIRQIFYDILSLLRKDKVLQGTVFVEHIRSGDTKERQVRQIIKWSKFAKKWNKNIFRNKDFRAMLSKLVPGLPQLKKSKKSSDQELYKWLCREMRARGIKIKA